MKRNSSAPSRVTISNRADLATADPRAWSFAAQRRRRAASYRLGPFHHIDSGPRVGFALGDRKAVYSVIFFTPDDARDLATQIRLMTAEETRAIPRSSNQPVLPELTMREQLARLWAIAKGQGWLAERCTIRPDYLSPSEAIVISLGAWREPEPHVAYDLQTSAALRLADRLERAASVSEELPPGSRVRPI